MLDTLQARDGDGWIVCSNSAKHDVACKQLGGQAAGTKGLSITNSQHLCERVYSAGSNRLMFQGHGRQQANNCHSDYLIAALWCCGGALGVLWW
jgi:hypothetical protein